MFFASEIAKNGMKLNALPAYTTSQDWKSKRWYWD